MPRAKLVLFTPGPVQIPASVADYLADPPCNYHRQDEFRQMFMENQADLKYLVGIRDPSAYFCTILLTSGTGANEACLQALSLLGQGMILRNGFFGARLVDQCVQDGIDHVVFDGPHDRPLDPDAVDAALAAHPDVKWVYFVSHETRAGLQNPIVEVGRACKRRGVMVGADTVSSAFAYPIHLEAAGLDLAATATSKALMAVPGLGLVFTRLAAVPALKAARAQHGKNRSTYLDLVAEYDRQAKEAQPRFGQPVQLHAAVRAACMHLRAVGIENHMRRIRRQLDDITAHLRNLGCEALLAPAYRSGIATNFRLPPGILYPELTSRMADEGYYVLYGVAEDPTMFQISTMGDLKEEQVAGLKRAFSKVLETRQRAVA